MGVGAVRRGPEPLVRVHSKSRSRAFRARPPSHPLRPPRLSLRSRRRVRHRPFLRLGRGRRWLMLKLTQRTHVTHSTRMMRWSCYTQSPTASTRTRVHPLDHPNGSNRPNHPRRLRRLRHMPYQSGEDQRRTSATLAGRRTTILRAKDTFQWRTAMSFRPKELVFRPLRPRLWSRRRTESLQSRTRAPRREPGGWKNTGSRSANLDWTAWGRTTGRKRRGDRRRLRSGT